MYKINNTFQLITLHLLYSSINIAKYHILKNTASQREILNMPQENVVTYNSCLGVTLIDFHEYVLHFYILFGFQQQYWKSVISDYNCDTNCHQQLRLQTYKLLRDILIIISQKVLDTIYLRKGFAKKKQEKDKNRRKTGTTNSSKILRKKLEYC